MPGAKTAARRIKVASKRRAGRKPLLKTARTISVEVSELSERGTRGAGWKAKLSIDKAPRGKKAPGKSKVAMKPKGRVGGSVSLELKPDLARKVLTGKTVRVEIKPPTERISAALAAALGEARERAEPSIGDLFAGPAMLSSDEFAKRLGVSRETVNQKRKRCEVIGLDGNARGFRYPEWQLIKGRPIPRLRELFARLENDAWAVYRFLTTPQPALGGETGVDAMRGKRTDQVLAVAQEMSQGAFS
jgi:hypothetical protein